MQSKHAAAPKLNYTEWRNKNIAKVEADYEFMIKQKGVKDTDARWNDFIYDAWDKYRKGISK